MELGRWTHKLNLHSLRLRNQYERENIFRIFKNAVAVLHELLFIRLFMRLETDLVRIKKIAYEKKNENRSFHGFLKQQKTDKIDAVVHHLNDKITPQIDCVTCGNCCKNLRPIPTTHELRKFVREKDLERCRYAMSFECMHLAGTKCSKYHERPEECRLYPYMDRNNFISRMSGVLQNYEICPIVFNIVEQLKAELKWNVEKGSSDELQCEHLPM